MQWSSTSVTRVSPVVLSAVLEGDASHTLGLWLRRLVVAAAFALIACGQQPTSAPPRSDAWSDLRSRPLQIASIHPGTPCPETAAGQIAVSGKTQPVMGTGPVYASAIALTPARISKIPWVADPTYTGPVLIRGRQLDGTTPLLLTASGNHASGRPIVRSIGGERFEFHQELDLLETGSATGAPWRFWPSSTFVATAGCYAWQVDTVVGHDIIIESALY